MSYIFGEGTATTYEDLQKQREIAKMLAARFSKSGMPTDFASGLTYFGQALAQRLARAKLEKSEAAFRDASESAWGDLTTVPDLDEVFGSSSQPGPTNEAASRRQEWPAGFDAQMPRDNLSYGPVLSMQRVPDDLRPMATDTTGKFQFSPPSTSFSTQGMEPLIAGVVETAAAIGADPEDLLTVMLYETAGSLDPMQPGPTTQWGRHRGLIQFGEPQAKEYGVDFSSPEAALRSQLGPDGAVARYFQSRGYKPGMSFADLYSTVNAGAPGLLGRTDENNGGAPGTVLDKVQGRDMAAFRERARAMLGQGVTMSTKDSPDVLRGTPPGADFSSVGDVRGPDTSLSWANEKERDELILRLAREGKVNPLSTQYAPVSLTNGLPDGVSALEFDVGMMPVTIDTPNGPVVVPASANLANSLATQLGGALPTRAIIEAMVGQGITPFTPQTPGPGMTGVDAARRQSEAVFGAVGQPQGPVVGPFKEILADGAFMGAYKADGSPYQPYTPGMGPHSGDYGDYSHGARMVGQTARIRMADGTVQEVPVSQIYSDPAYASALGLSGPIQVQGAGDTDMQGNPGTDRMGAVSYGRNPNPVDIMPMAGGVQMPPQGPVQQPPQPRTQPANWWDDADPQRADMALVKKLMDYQRQYGPAMSDYQKQMVDAILKREFSQPGAPGYKPPAPDLKFIDGVGFVDLNNVPPELMAGRFQPSSGDKPSSVREYEYYREGALARGEQPMSYEEFMVMDEKAGVPPGTPNIGSIPQGFSVVIDPNDPSGYRMVRIPGGPEDTTEADAASEAAKATSANIVLDEIDIARSLIEGADITSPATGVVGSLLSRIDQTRAGALKNRLETIKANIGFDKLQAMRDASPTGGALGQVSEFENRLLQAVYGSLAQAQSADDLLYNLARLEELYSRVINEGIADDEARALTREFVTRRFEPPPAPAEAPPSGVPQTLLEWLGGNAEEAKKVWDVMTPEEKALFSDG